MIKNDCILRTVRKEEYEETENLVRECFWNVYRPGCLEHYLLNQLRKAEDYMPCLDFVVEKDGVIAGQNIFANAVITADDGRKIPVATMGPVSVLPEYRRKGIGRFLLEKSLQIAADSGIKAVFIEGDIAFYGKSGFVPARQYGIRYHGLPEGADASFFLCKVLVPGCLEGITGEYSTPQVYFVDETEREIFDKKFPGKEKLILPGQLF